MQRTLLLLSLSWALTATAGDPEWPHVDDWQDAEPNSVSDRSPSDQELYAAYKQRLKERRRVALLRRYAKYGRKIVQPTAHVFSGRDSTADRIGQSGQLLSARFKLPTEPAFAQTGV